MYINTELLETMGLIKYIEVYMKHIQNACLVNWNLEIFSISKSVHDYVTRNIRCWDLPRRNISKGK
jgi:hypothetical protein